jgi:hypothetical protein
MNADDLKVVDQTRFRHIYLITPLTNEKAWYSDLIAGKNAPTVVSLDNNFLESQPGIFNVATNTKESMFSGIWKIK